MGKKGIKLMEVVPYTCQLDPQMLSQALTPLKRHYTNISGYTYPDSSKHDSLADPHQVRPMPPL